jgi:tetratricopeptide (TPR) repeat protein
MPYRLTRRAFLEHSGLAATFLFARPRRGLAEEGCRIQTTSLLAPNLQKFAPLVTPGSDEFVCEKHAAELQPLLSQLSNELHSSLSSSAWLSQFLSPDVSFTPFDRPLITPLRSSGQIKTERVTFPSSEARGRDACVASWHTSLSSLAKVQSSEFQIVDLQVVSENPLTIDTRIRYQLFGQLQEDRREERVGSWSMQWRKIDAWRIVHWQPAGEMRASLEGPGFAEVTEACLGKNRSYREQMALGVDHWRTTLDSACGLDVYGNNGIAVGDFDNDGHDDFYVCQPAGLPNRLYRNRGDGTFEDVSAAFGLDLLDGTASALFADFTNSGTQDLLVVCTNGPLLFLNQGGKFTLRQDAFRFANPPAGTFTGVAAADYNRDGLLDIYFCLYAYYQGLSQYNHPRPYYDAQNGPPNFLMRNRGDGTFEDVTASTGMNQNNNRFSFACGWCDSNGNGWPDLYVANDFGRKNFYRNNGDGTFTDVAEQAGVEDYGAGMSVSWSDFDNDGRPDLYVTDMWSAAGTRVTNQTHFLPGVEENVRRAYRKHASGNAFFHNDANGTMRDDTARAGVAMGRWSWAGDAWDFDHDGYSDLYVTNGFISGPNRQDLSSFFWRQIVARSLEPGSGALDYELAWNAINELIRADHSWNGYERNVCFTNNHDGTFSETSALLGLDFEDDSRSFALADIDGDGRLEVLLKNRNAPQLRILRNEMRSLAPSLSIRLRGSKGNRDAIGAMVTLERGSLRQVRQLQAGSGFLAQHTKELHFGLGSNTQPVRITVAWPSGASQTFENIPAGHRITFTEGEQHFSSEPFRTSLAPDESASARAIEHALPTSFGTWLVEPMRAADFELADLSGKRWTLKQFTGKPLLLILTSGTCSASKTQLSEFVRQATTFRSAGIALLAISLDEAGARQSSPAVPVVAADKTTAGVYGILYRYLFDRRRELETPIAFLCDAESSIIKVYQGPVAVAQVVRDWKENPATTETRLRKALALDGRFHGAVPRRNYFTYGVAFLQAEHVDAALQCFQEAIARNPKYAAAHYNLGTIYLNKQMLPEARAALERAVAIDPHDADAWTNLGAIAGQQKQYDEAIEYFRQAIGVRPTHLVALQNLVMLYRWQGHIDLAEKALRSAIQADPNDPEFHFALGMLLASGENFEASRSELERTMELRPGDFTTLNNLGVVFLRLNRQADAMNCFEQAIKLSPDYDRAYLNVALTYQQTGQTEKAKSVLQSFASRHPENEEVRKALQELGR